jgi:hypothetical protein
MSRARPPLNRSGVAQSLDERGDVGGEAWAILPARGMPDAGVHEQFGVGDELFQLLLHVASEQSVGIAPDQHRWRRDAPELAQVV